MHSRLSSNKLLNLLIIVVILTLPLMYAGLFTWAYEKPMDKLGDITAVVINNDQPATATLKDGSTLHLNLGKDLTDELYKQGAPGFHWVPSTDPKDAEKGLQDGTYQVALWIPSDLSSNLAQLSELKNPQPTTLRLETNDGINYLTGTMAHSVALTLQNIASEKGAGRFADHLLLSLGDIHTGMNTAANGAADLNDGTSKLEKGANELHSGALQITTSVGQLANGTDTLAAGLNAYTQGVTTANNGAQTLAANTALFSNKMGDLSSGLATLNNKVNSADGLKDGVNKLVAATASTPNPADQSLANGAEALKKGAAQLATGAAKAENGASKLKAGINQLHEGAKAAKNSLPDLQKGVRNLRAQLAKGSQQNPTIGYGVDMLNNQLHGDFGNGVKKMAAQTEMLVVLCTSDQFKEDNLCKTIASGLQLSGLSFSDLKQNATQLTTGVTELAAAAKNTSDALDAAHQQSAPLEAALSNGTDPTHPTTLADFINATAAQTGKTPQSPQPPAHPTLADGATSLHDALNQLAAGAQTLQTGAEKEAKGVTALHQGLTQLQAGVTQLDSAINQVATGANALNTAGQKLATGTHELAAGTQKLNAASPQLRNGTARLNAGAHALFNGSQKLASGANDLASGESKAADGAQTLHNKLRDGANKVPDLTQDHASSLSKVAAQPIKVKAIRTNAVRENGVGFAPFFMCLAMWVGGIAMFLLLPALDKRRHKDEKFWVCAARSFATTAPFAIAQAIIVVLGLELMLGLGAKDLGLLFAVCIMTALTFILINQGFIALLGFRGRFASVLMLLLQITSAGATFPIETTPHFFHILHPLLPMTYCAQAIREYIAGANLPVFHGFWVVLLWAAIGVAMTLLGAWLHPGERPMKHDPAFAFPKHAHASA